MPLVAPVNYPSFQLLICTLAKSNIAVCLISRCWKVFLFRSFSSKMLEIPQGAYSRGIQHFAKNGIARERLIQLSKPYHFSLLFIPEVGKDSLETFPHSHSLSLLK